MKRILSNWEKEKLLGWPKIYEVIYKNDWPKVKGEFENKSMGFDVPEDIRIAFLSLFSAKIEFNLKVKGPIDFLGNNSIYELLTGTSKKCYTIQEGQDLVRWYIMNYWSSQYK